MRSSIFFFNDTATTDIYTLSLHDALPISVRLMTCPAPASPSRPATPATMARPGCATTCGARAWRPRRCRSEEHTSELQSQSNLVCRLLLDKKYKCKI